MWLKKATMMMAMAGAAVFLACAASPAFAADAAEQTDGVQPADNTEYPDWWDDEDPENAKAYEQLYGEEETKQPLLDAGSALTSAYTTIWTVKNDDGTTYTKTFTHSENSAAGRNICAAIDVSYHQGSIDWTQVRADGIQYAFIRIGYRGYASGSLAEDSKFRTYVKEAQAAGIKVGVYFFSQAITEAEAVEEAEFVLNKLSACGFGLDLPIAFDPEYVSVKQSDGSYSYVGGRYYDANLSKAQKTAIANAFCRRIASAGYPAMVYSSSSWYVSELDADSLGQNYMLWMSRYNSYAYKSSETNRYGGKVDVWQCSSRAQVSGISTNVDLDWIYMDGVCNFRRGADGNWYYIENGTTQPDVTRLIYGTVNGETAWWYVKNGIVSFTTTVASNDYGWWYVENGKVNFDYTGIANNEYGWWRIEDGQVNFGFDGFAQNGAGWWYLENGAVQFNVTNILPGTVNGDYAWWYIQDGHVIFTNTVAQNDYGWWYVENGKVNFSHNGIEQNEYGWWRIEDGHVNFGFNGFAQNGAGWWYLEGGAVNFNVTSILPGTVNGNYAWWYIRDGHVIFTTTVAPNDYGWWYVENGKVDFSHDGIAQNEYGWWRIENGHVNFGFEGLAKNGAGWWYLKGGAVQFGFSGTVYGTVNGKYGAYTVQNGYVYD